MTTFPLISLSLPPPLQTLSLIPTKEEEEQRWNKKNKNETRKVTHVPGYIIDLDHDDTRTKDERRDETRRDETRQSQFTYDATKPSSRLFFQIGTAILAPQLALRQIKSQLPNRPKQPRPSSPCPELQRVPSPKLETSSELNRYTRAVGLLFAVDYMTPVFHHRKYAPEKALEHSKLFQVCLPLKFAF